MNVEDIKDITGKLPKWETQLWSHVSSGDGTHCPLYSRCLTRRKGRHCPNDGDLGKRMRNTWLSSAGDYRVLMNDFEFLDFTQSIIACKMFRLIEKLAQNYLRKAGVFGPPVPVEVISRADENNPVEIHLLPLKDYHGAIWRLDDKWVIQLKESDIDTVRRFTLFHEAFHILAHCRATPVFNKPGHGEAYFNELLADHFANCVLMPTEWVLQKWTEVKNLGKMAEIFGVWESYMWFKLKRLCLI